MKKINLNDEKPFLSKKVILEHVTDYDVYSKYISIPFEIGGKPMLSPLRTEKTPSFGFFIGENNEICFNDFKQGGGDFVKFVQLKFDLPYYTALSKIACDFEFDKDYLCKTCEKTTETYIPKQTKEEFLAKVTGFRLGKNKREWQIHDITYWEQFGISIPTLEFFKVEPISYIYIGDKIYPADKYAYCFKELKDGKETYKIYQPFNEKYKWINNHNDSVWQGWEQLPNSGTDLIVTKSLKDVMSLYEVVGYSAVALQSENTIPKLHVFENLKERFKDITILYDNDYDKEINWGQKFGNKLASELGGVINCCIPNRYECKDFSDLVKKYGRIDAKEILLKKTLMPF